MRQKCLAIMIVFIAVLNFLVSAKGEEKMEAYCSINSGLAKTRKILCDGERVFGLEEYSGLFFSRIYVYDITDGVKRLAFTMSGNNGGIQKHNGILYISFTRGGILFDRLIHQQGVVGIDISRKNDRVLELVVDVDQLPENRREWYYLTQYGILKRETGEETVTYTDMPFDPQMNENTLIMSRMGWVHTTFIITETLEGSFFIYDIHSQKEYTIPRTDLSCEGDIDSFTLTGMILEEVLFYISDDGIYAYSFADRSNAKIIEADGVRQMYSNGAEMYAIDGMNQLIQYDFESKDVASYALGTYDVQQFVVMNNKLYALIAAEKRIGSTDPFIILDLTAIS